MPIDWSNLADDVEATRPSGESVGKKEVSKAIVLLMGGADEIRAAVHHYVEGRRGSELARGVLWQLRDQAGMDECIQIFRSDAPILHRRMAVELLRVVCDRRVLEFMHEILADPDDDIVTWGAGILDQLVSDDSVSLEDIRELVELAQNHQSAGAQRYANLILNDPNLNT
jgi:hypothetical protein